LVLARLDYAPATIRTVARSFLLGPSIGFVLAARSVVTCRQGCRRYLGALTVRLRARTVLSQFGRRHVLGARPSAWVAQECPCLFPR
jgi:hypothetical protein